MPLFLNFSPHSLFSSFSLSHILYIFFQPLPHTFSVTHSFTHSVFLSLSLSFFLFLFLSSGRLKKVFTAYANSAFILSFKYHLTASSPTALPLANGRRFIFSRTQFSSVTYSFGFSFFSFFWIFLQFINYEIRRGFTILMFLLPGPLTFLEKIFFAPTLY